MNYWLLRADCNKDLVLRTELNYFENRFKGKSMVDSWRPPEDLQILGKTKRLRDFVSWMIKAPVISSKAKEALEPSLKDFCEFFPLIELRGRLYWALNVLKMVDVVDWTKSDVQYGSDDKKRIVTVSRYSFKPMPPVNVPIFKVLQYPSDVFVTRTFLSIVKEHQLQGAGFADPAENQFVRLFQGRSLWTAEELLV